MNSNLFTEKYNPTSLESFILPERIKKQFENGITNHVLFYGTHGIGKSSLGKFLVKGKSYKYINASQEGRIDVLRNDITDFCANVQLNEDGDKSDVKYVFLDEIDGVSPAFFDALKGFMDTFQRSVRFIATSNYVNKIPSPIKDRFDCINFNAASSEEESEITKLYAGRTYGIITKSLGLQIDRSSLDYLVKKNFPSMRSTLKDLQRLTNSGVTKIDIESLKSKTYEFKELYDLILGGIAAPEKIHTILMGDYATKVSEVLSALDDPFIKYIMDNNSKYNKLIPHITITVAEYQSKLPLVIDPAISMKACVFKLAGLAHKMNHPSK